MHERAVRVAASNRVPGRTPVVAARIREVGVVGVAGEALRQLGQRLVGAVGLVLARRTASGACADCAWIVWASFTHLAMSPLYSRSAAPGLRAGFSISTMASSISFCTPS